VLALEPAVDLGLIGLKVTAMTLLGADRSEQCRLQRGIGDLSQQCQLSPALASRFNVNRIVDGATPTRRAISLIPTPFSNEATSRTRHTGILSDGIRSPVQKANRSGP
jgi:hypothetical protein